MDASPQLLTSIEFREARKGYNREQVDGFLRELSLKVGELKEMLRQATQRAEAAEAAAQVAAVERSRADAARAEATEALEASEQARAELAETVAALEGREEPVVDEVQAATGMLALAKQTADAAVEAAELQAQRRLEEAEANATVTVIEAQQRAERLTRQAHEEIEALRSHRLEELDSRVHGLAAQRDALQGDVAGLQSYLEEQRRSLRTGVEALVKILDEGPAFVPPEPPELSDVVLDLDDDADEAEGASQSDSADSPESSDADLPRRAESEAEARTSHIPHLLEGPNGGPVMRVEDEDPDRANAPAIDLRAVGEDAATRDDLMTGGTAAELAALDVEDAGPGATSPLGRPRADADAAMRDFFEPGGPADRRSGILKRH